MSVDALTGVACFTPYALRARPLRGAEDFPEFLGFVAHACAALPVRE